MLLWPRRRSCTTRGQESRRDSVAGRRRLLFEHCEPRWLLATLVNTGTSDDVVYTLPAGTDSIFLEDDGVSGNGSLQLRSTNGVFDTTVFANPVKSLTINRGDAADAITLNSLPDLSASLTIGTAGSPFAGITVAGTVALAIDSNIMAFASGKIGLNGTSKLAVSGAGTISLTTAKNIALSTTINGNASITSVNGNISLWANQQAPATSGNFIGIDLDGSTIKAAGGGTIIMQGKGGDTGDFQYGVQVRNGAKITGGTGGLQITGVGGASPTGAQNYGVAVMGMSNVVSAVGPVTVLGTGGTGTGNFNTGVLLLHSGSTIKSISSNVLVTGTGFGSGNGVQVNSSAQISAGGNGSITIQGKGGDGSAQNVAGVDLYQSSIVTSGGDIQITGQGGTGSALGYNGVDVYSSQVTAGGSGNIKIQGTIGNGLFSSGVVLGTTGSAITTNSGTIEITGILGHNVGTSVETSGGSISTTAAGGVVTLIGDRMSLHSSSSIGSAAGTVVLRPLTAGIGVNLGITTDGSISQLGLSDGELDQVVAGNLQIGDANTGPITISANLTRPAATNTSVISGGTIGFDGGSLNTNGGNLTVTPGKAASASFAIGGVDANLGAGRLGFGNGSDVLISVNGKTVDAQYQQLNVTGAVNLTGASLTLFGTFNAAPGDTFILVNNDGSDAITGTFTGLSEGAVVSSGLSGSYQITYRGGDGNDVAITAVIPGQSLQGTTGDDTWLLKRNGNNVDVTLNGAALSSLSFTSLSSLTVNSLAGKDTLNLDLSAGDVIPAGGLTFNGGDPTTAPGDTLNILGGVQGTVTYSYTNGHDGKIEMSNFGTVNYTGLEPINNTGSVTSLIFNLPASASNATLEDDVTVGNGISQLRSISGTFETTSFANPANDITINRGNASDTITVNSLPDLSAGLNLGSLTLPLGAVTLNGTVTPATAKSVSVYGTAQTVTATGNITTSGGGTIQLTADSLDINPVAMLNAGTGIVQISPLSSGRPVTLGAETAGALSLSDRELDRIVAGTLRIGDKSRGAITISGPINVANNQSPIPTLHLYSRGAVVDNVVGVPAIPAIQVANLAIEGAGGAGPTTRLLMQVNSFAAAYSGNGPGGLLVNNDSSSLTVGTVDGIVGVSNDSDSLILESVGSLTVNSQTSSSAFVGLGVSGNDKTLTINSTVTGGGDCMFIADKMSIQSGVSCASGTVTLVPVDIGMDLSDGIDLGSATDVTPNTLELSSAELSQIVAKTLQIGGENTGPITISADVSPKTGTSVSLSSGGAINFAGGAINTGGGNLTLTPGGAASVVAAEAGVDVNLGTAGMIGALKFAQGSDLSFTLNGNTADSQYQQLNVVGSVDLTGVDLALIGSGPPAVGSTFTLVKNNGNDPITGVFNGLPEGKVFSVAQGSFSETFQITYQGGDGNDVVLVVEDPNNSVLLGTTGDDNWLVKRAASNLEVTLNNALFFTASIDTLNSLTINGLDGNDTLTVDLSNGDVIPPSSIAFDGGSSSAVGDQLIITGGTQGTVTFSYGSNQAGSVVSDFGTVTYQGLEHLADLAAASQVVFNAPTGPNTVTLSDAGTTGNLISRLSASTLLPTDFANPTGSVRFNRGSAADTLSVNAIPDFSASLVIGAEASPWDAVSFGGPVALASASTLTAIAQSISIALGAPVTTHGGSINVTATDSITLNDALISNGGDITLHADSNADGQGLVTVGSSSVGSLNWQAMLTAADGAVGDIFGSRVAISSDGNTALISSFNDDVGANSNQGSATVFTRVNGVWGQQQQLTMAAGAASDQFGLAVALSADGNTAIVGASGDNVGSLSDQGSATVFVRNNGTWTPQQMLVATDALAGDHFGFSTALSADGNTAIIGQFKDAGTDSGSAYVFTRSGSVWSQQQRVTSLTAAPLDRFGYSVALSSDGNIALVGAEKDDVGSNTDQGSATVFTRSNGSWTEQQQLLAQAGAAGDSFGRAVSLSSSGKTALIGSPASSVSGKGAARIFALSNGIWTELQKLTPTNGANSDQFGASVAISGDGISAIIGTPGINGGKGSAALFTNQGGTWTQQQLVTAQSAATSDFFGQAVAANQDASTVLVGSSNDDIGTNTDQGSAFVFLGAAISHGSIAADSGSIILSAADVDIRGTVSSRSKVTLASPQLGRPIILGTSVAGAFNLSDDDLDRVSAGSLEIGNSLGGPISVSDNITRSALTDINLMSGGAINFVTGSIDTFGGNCLLSPGVNSSVGVATAGVDIAVGAGFVSLAKGANLAIAINGISADADLQQLRVGGHVDLTDVNLILSGTFSPASGDMFTIVKNDGSGDVLGEFNGLPEGKTFHIATGALAGNYTFTYHGGDGNDVVLTAVNIPPSFDHLAGDYTASDEDPATHGPALEQVVSGWATNIAVGPAHESNQKLVFIVHTDNPDLFAVPPGVDAETGVLSYTPAPNKHGMAHVTVVLQDDGGGTDTSLQTSFNIVIIKTHPLHNAAESGERSGLDVTGSTSTAPDGSITPSDALAVINYINAKGAGSIPASVPIGAPYVDVNGDDEVIAQDVLDVINWINSHPGQSEAEAAPASLPVANNPPSDLMSLLAVDIADQAARRRRI
jgi:hypothetical protein